jgi:hypothetical protein
MKRFRELLVATRLLNVDGMMWITILVALTAVMSFIVVFLTL